MLKPTNIDLQERIQAARCSEAAGRFPEAVQILARLLKTHPGHSEVLLALAKLSDRMGNPQDAQSLLRLALQVHPSDIELRMEYASTL